MQHAVLLTVSYPATPGLHFMREVYTDFNDDEAGNEEA